MSPNTPHPNPLNVPQAMSLALQHHQAGRLTEAETLYRRIIDQQPDCADAWHLLGVIAAQAGKEREGIELMNRAVRLNPNSAVYYVNLSIALVKTQQSEAAANAAQNVIRLDPTNADAWNNLGVALKDLGRLDDSLAAYRRTLAIRPEDNQAASNIIFTMLFHSAYDASAIYQELQLWRARYADELKNFIQPHHNDRDPQRRLKIGYVSPDFFSHSQSFFMLPLLQNHDHRQFEIVCYSRTQLADYRTEQIRRCADVWRDVQNKNPAQIAEQIYRDRIDILVDLTMHMANSNLLIFARKPAPVQVTWLAYPGSTGLDVINYRFTDPYLDPPGLDDAYYSEESFRLPDTFWCYDPLIDESRASEFGINDLPALKNGYITFGCLNNFCKINQGVLQLWAKVFAAISNSRLLLLTPKGQGRRELLDNFSKLGVDPKRVELADFSPRVEYLRLYHRIDIGLDTVPYNGHTTSLDSFWMGVPVVTLIGKTVVGRAGWSQLSNLGLGELATKTPEEFVDVVSRLANDLPRLKELRTGLRRRIQQSPLMDAKRFAGNLESAYRRMWQKWCSSGSPA